MSAWSEYKKKLGDTRPWDILNPKTEYATDDLSQHRMSICEGCDRLLKVTKQCKECGCFMSLKTKLKEAVCPLEKW